MRPDTMDHDVAVSFGARRTFRVDADHVDLVAASGEAGGKPVRELRRAVDVRRIGFSGDHYA